MSSIRPKADTKHDADLVRAVQTGDEQAFRLLYDRYSGYVASTIFRLIGRDADVDDLVQETFVEAFLSIGSVRDPERIRGWLATIAVRRTKRALAQRYRRDLLHHLLKGRAKSSGPQDARSRQLAEALYEALDRLPPKLRIPWTLRHIQGHSLAEVAELCEVSLATVKRRIAKADQRLKKALKNA